MKKVFWMKKHDEKSVFIDLPQLIFLFSRRVSFRSWFPPHWHQCLRVCGNECIARFTELENRLWAFVLFLHNFSLCSAFWMILKLVKKSQLTSYLHWSAQKFQVAWALIHFASHGRRDLHFKTVIVVFVHTFIFNPAMSWRFFKKCACWVSKLTDHI